MIYDLHDMVGNFFGITWPHEPFTVEFNHSLSYAPVLSFYVGSHKIYVPAQSLLVHCRPWDIDSLIVEL